MERYLLERFLLERFVLAKAIEMGLAVWIGGFLGRELSGQNWIVGVAIAMIMVSSTCQLVDWLLWSGGH